MEVIMAKVIGMIPEKELRKRIKRTKKVRYQKPLRVPFGTILKEALEAERKS
jgi:hypothetical protein